MDVLGWNKSLAGAMKEAGIFRIRTSIFRRQNTVAQFIGTRPIMDLCKKSTRRPGARVARRWWEQTGIDWKGARERAEAIEAAEAGTKAFTDLESEADDAMDGTGGGTGEEASLVRAGPVERSGAGRRKTNTLTFIGIGAKAGTELSNFKLKRDRV